jgi:phage FluMu protein Com
MIDVRCKSCNKLLAKAETMNAAIKCPRCSMIFEYHIYSTYSNANYLPTSNKAVMIKTETTESAENS